MRKIMPHNASSEQASQLKKVLLVINADTSKQTAPPQDRSKERLADYTALRTALQGDILDWNDIRATVWAKLMAKVGGKGITLATLAFMRRKRYSLFYCDSENNGLALAFLFKLSRSNYPLLMIGHWITPPKKAFLFKWLRLHSHITTLFLHSSAQYNEAIDQLGIPPKKLQMLPYQVDTEFWKAEHAHPSHTRRPYICTAGLEFRDYPTLIEAVRGLELDLKIGAASYWSKRRNSSVEVALPTNVSVNSYNYEELRDLYAGSRFVVITLYDMNFQAGITVILEAMAMGKAVIVTRTHGQGDTVVDRRDTVRTEPPRSAKGKFTELFGGNEVDGISGLTGYYVGPNNVEELRRSIQHMLDHPKEAAEMGARGRRTVETLMSVEQFAARIRRSVYETIEEPLSVSQPEKSGPSALNHKNKE
ncbi:MAG: glycosyltransferase family 4 protein [Chloroflexota bacterium]